MSKFFAISIEKSLYVEIKAENSDEAVDMAWKMWEENPPEEEIFVEGEYRDDEKEEE